MKKGAIKLRLTQSAAAPRRGFVTFPREPALTEASQSLMFEDQPRDLAALISKEGRCFELYVSAPA